MASDVEEDIIEGDTPDESTTLPGQKRKRTDEQVEAKRAKRALKRQQAKQKKSGGAYGTGEVDETLQVNNSIGKMSPSMLADYFARQMKRFEPKLSLVELEDRRVPEKALIDTTDWPSRRTVDEIADFLIHYGGTKAELSKTPSSLGSPSTLVVASSGIRAAQLTRALRAFQTKDAHVAKLFAKHIKLKDAIETTRNTRMNIGVGTPQRVLDLIEQGSLTLSELERVVIDASFTGVKQQGILEMADTEPPLSRLLACHDLKKRLQEREDGAGTVVLVY